MSMVVRNSLRGRERFTKITHQRELPRGYSLAANNIKLKFAKLDQEIAPPVWQPPNPHDAFDSHKKPSLHVSDKIDGGKVVSSFRKFVGSDHHPLMQQKIPVNQTQYFDVFTFDSYEEGVIPGVMDSTNPSSPSVYWVDTKTKTKRGFPSIDVWRSWLPWTTAISMNLTGYTEGPLMPMYNASTVPPAYAQFLGDIPLSGYATIVDGSGSDYARVWFCIRDYVTNQELYRFASGTDCARGWTNNFYGVASNIQVPGSRALKLSVRVESVTDDNIRIDVNFFKFVVTASVTDEVQLYGGQKGWGGMYVIASRGLLPGNKKMHWVGNFTTPQGWQSCYFNLPVERFCRGTGQVGGGSGTDQCYFTFILQNTANGQETRLVSMPRDLESRWAPNNRGFTSDFVHVYYANKADRDHDGVFDGSCANVQLSVNTLYNMFIEVMSNTDDVIRYSYDGIVYKLSEQPGRFLTRPDLLISGRGEESIMYPGDELIALDGGCRLTLTHDYGELLITNPDGTYRWTAGVDGGPNACLIMHSHGDCALYNASGRKVWATDTLNTNLGPFKLCLLPVGSMVLINDHIEHSFSTKSGPTPPSASDIIMHAVF